MKKVHPQEDIKTAQPVQNQLQMIDLESAKRSGSEEAPVSLQHLNSSPTDNANALKQQGGAPNLSTVPSIKQISQEKGQTKPLKSVKETENQNIDKNIESKGPIPDLYMAIFFIVSFLLWIALGIYAFKASDPFEKIEKAHNFKQYQIVDGLYSVIISLCITFIFGLIILFFLFKYTYKTLSISLLLSIFIMIALTVYSFYEKYIALGVVSAVVTVLVIAIGLNIYESINVLEKIAELSFQFQYLKKKYLILLLCVSLVILLECAFSILGFVNIIFTLVDSTDNQQVLIFFCAAFCFLSYWIIGSSIKVYCFCISRKCSRWYFSSEVTQNSDVENQNPNQKQSNTNQGDNNNNVQQHCSQKTNTLPVSKVHPKTDQDQNKDIQVTDLCNQEDPLKQNSDQCNQIQNPVIEDQKSIIKNTNNTHQSESILQTVAIAFRHIGSITYGSLLSQVFNCVFFIVQVLVYCSGLIFIFREDMRSCYQYLTRMKIYLSIVRLTYDAQDYCQSFKLVGQSLASKSYVFMFALWGINETTNVVGFFIFIAGFATGTVMIIRIDYNYWYVICLYIFLIFVVSKQASLLMIANYQMIVYSLATYYDIERKKKLKTHHEKYNQIQKLIHQAYKNQKEPMDIKDFY